MERQQLSNAHTKEAGLSPLAARAAALRALLERDAHAEAAQLLTSWKEQAEEQANSDDQAWTLEQLAGLQLHYGLSTTALLFLLQSATLYQQSRNYPGVVRVSWRLGTLLAESRQLAAALRHLRRALALAEELGLPERTSYRIYVRAVQSVLELQQE